MKSLQINKKVILGLSTLVVSSLLSFSLAAGEYFGFDSYEGYLNNYYSQQAHNAVLPTLPTTPASQIAQTVKRIEPVTVFTPAPQAQQTVVAEPVNNYYNGFASYQDYLNNYYASIGNPRSIAPITQTPVQALQPLQTQACLTVSDILKTDIAGQYLACDGTLYTVTLNDNVVAAGTEFLWNYNIGYELIETVVEEAPVIYTPVYVYPEVEARTEVVSPVAAVEFNTATAVDFQVGNVYTFTDGLSLSVLEINDNRCFAGQYCAQAGEVVARFMVEFRDEQNLLTVTMEPGEEPEINFLLANTAIKFVDIKYDQINGQPMLQSIVRSR